MKNKINEITQTVQELFANSTQKKYWEHTERVLSYVKFIGKKEGANLDILIPAALLHDIGMTVDASFKGHIIKSQLISQGILLKAGYSKKEIGLIINVIGSHHPEPGAILQSLEEKVLFDADNMEIIGVFGILRWVGSLPNTLTDLKASADLFLSIAEKSKSVRGSLFYTNTGKEIGHEIFESTIEYFKELNNFIVTKSNNLPANFPITI